MTDAFWTAFFGNLPGTIAATVGLIAAVVAAVASFSTKRELVTRDTVANSKLDVIHDLTNSTLAAAKAAIEVLEQQNFELRAINEQLEKRLRLVEGQLRRELLKTPPEEPLVVERPPS